MAVQKVSIETYTQNAEDQITIDVRSPLEFEHAHIPGAYSLPLFNNEQRAIVGTTYKKQSRENAIKIALPMFGDKMLEMVNQVETWVKNYQENHEGKKPSILVHCWRGGMRSAAVAWLLDLYGFRVTQLIGGYKAYRNWIIAHFEKQYELKIVGGYTGSGKTEILHALKLKGEHIIDLEGLANHKGSSFGAIGQATQPSQEMFENLLGLALSKLSSSQKCIWIEDESQRIGSVMVPTPFFKLMRESICYFVNIPFEKRLQFIVKQYGGFEKADLIGATERIQKRLGGLETKNTIQLLETGDIQAAFGILLKYYDKWYEKFTQPEANQAFPKLAVIKWEAADVKDKENAELLLALNESILCNS
jgi:tRNA 2-selenouridine synthase